MSLLARFRMRPADATGQVFRGMAQLAMGSVAARAISILTVPLLSRIYQPADYGVLSVYTSLLQILFPLLTLRYCVALPLPRRDETALTLFTLSGGLLLVLGLMLGVLLAIFAEPLFTLLSVEALIPWWWLLVIGLLTTSLADLLNFWVTRKRSYKLLARNTFAIVAIGESLKIGLGLLGLKPFGLLFGQMAGQSGGIASFTRAFWQDFRRIPRVVTRRRLVFVARHYLSFPIYRAPSQFLLAFAMQAPLLFTASLFGVDVSGQLGLALLTLALPVNLIGQAAGKAYYAEISLLGRKRLDEIRSVTGKLQLRLLVIGLLPAGVLMAFGPTLFTFAFGEPWLDAGRYASILSVYMLLQFTSAPLMQLLNVLNKQNVFLYLNLTRVLLVLGLFALVSVLDIGVDAYVFSYGVIMVVFYGLITGYVFSLVRRRADATGS